jgi:NAD(P)-dependent dehydrogenase (short-subunit alcohol dehydrogenase family)
VIDPAAPAALVTGAAKRLGRAIALALAEDGYAVAVHYNRSRAEAETTVADIAKRGGRAAAIGADLAEGAAAGAILARAAEALGSVGVLVNNASLFERDLLASVTPESWRAHMAVNLEAPVFLTQAFARALPKGASGSVINMIDQKVLNLSPFYLSYTAAKAGLWALTRTLALELAPRIRVNAIGPGPTLPNATQTEVEFARYAGAMPLGRAVGLDEVTRTVRYILAMPSLTGHLIPIDSGEHLGWSTPKAWRDAKGPG